MLEGVKISENIIETMYNSNQFIDKKTKHKKNLKKTSDQNSNQPIIRDTRWIMTT